MANEHVNSNSKVTALQKYRKTKTKKRIILAHDIENPNSIKNKYVHDNESEKQKSKPRQITL